MISLSSARLVPKALSERQKDATTGGTTGWTAVLRMI